MKAPTKHQRHIASVDLCLFLADVNELGDERPLDAAQLRAIDANAPRLLDLLDPTDFLLSSLAADSVLTPSQRDDVREARTSGEKVGKLMDLMARKSVADFGKFVDYLASQNQAHVADILRLNGGN